MSESRIQEAGASYCRFLVSSVWGLDRMQNPEHRTQKKIKG